MDTQKLHQGDPKGDSKNFFAPLSEQSGAFAP